MEQDILKKQLEALNEAKRSKNVAVCDQTITVINEYFDLPKSTNETKYAVELILRESDKKIDLLMFIIRAFTEKDLQNCAIKIYELIHKVITLHSIYVKPFSKKLTEISQQCLKYNTTSARFKEMAVKTIAELIEKDVLDEEVDIADMILKLMAVLNQNVKNRLFSDVYELLGTLSKKYPENLSYLKGVELRNIMVTAIQKLFKDDKATYSMTLVAGAIKGLNSHLVNFSPKEEDNQFKEKLYECMVQLTDPRKHESLNSQSNRVVFRNMLEIVQNYGHLVSDLLFHDYLKWHIVLLMWLNSKAYEDKNSGFYAIGTFHNEIAANIERRKNESDKPVLMFFMNFFQKTLESPKSEPHEIRIAIRGFGSMAVACKILLEPKYLSDRFDLVMQRTEYSYYTGDKMKRREVLEYLPSFIEALSKIMNQLDAISGIQMHSLQSVLVVLIKDFHFLSTSHHNLVAISLLETFSNLQKSGGKVLEDVLETVIWQGILWTCSHQLTYDLQENIENIKDWKETITYKRYLPLWKRILTPENENYEIISTKIYEYFIKDLFIIIDKLDLSTKKRKYHDESTGSDVEFYFTDPSLDLEPTRAENFQILYNLVQFYQDILTTQSVKQLDKYFVDWMELWLDKTIQLSYKHSLISAFMHFIEIALSIMDQTRYTSESNDMANKFKTVEILKSYIRTLFPRCLQTSGELQVSCLQLIFKSPSFLLIDHIHEMTNILIIGFTVGKSVLSLAHHALSCFEALVQSLHEDYNTRMKLLKDVMPYLESFLSTSKETTTETELKVLKYRKKKSKAVIQNIETDLMKMKRRILLFLGTCSPNESQLILSSFEQKLIKDYITELFKVKLESDDPSFPLIFLDPIVERVVHLSLYSSDRSVKVSACELLHGLVLYMMGKNLERKEPLPMWRNLCKTIIILGADKDQTVRQLFEPLLMQMTHYYSQPSKILSPLSFGLMESVMEMMSYKENGIQDLSARLLREYIIWLMRQTSREQRKISPVRLVDFFQELRKFSIDADQSKRLAASLGFNNIYRIVREEESLVDVYWIYLLDIFCANFRNTEEFSENIDIYFFDKRRFEQISTSLDHLTRVFIECTNLFHQVNRKRIVPKGFRGMTLKDVLNFLFEQCAKPQYFYRHKCMDMFTKILAEYNTKDFYYNENWNIEKIIKIGDESTGILKHPDLKYLSDFNEPIFKEIHSWLRGLLSALEFYQWIFENGLIPQDQIETFLSKTVIVNSLEFFLNRIVMNDMVDLLRSINENLLNNTQVSLEMRMHNRNLDKINVIKNLILMKVLDFFNVLMRQHRIENILMNNMQQLIKLIKRLIFKPHRLNFDYKTINIIHDFRERLISFIKISGGYSSEFTDSLLSTVQNKVMKYLNELCHNCDQILKSKSVTETDENKLVGLNMMITHFYNEIDTNDLSHNLILKSAETLLSKIFDGIVEKINDVKRPQHLTPNIKKFATKLVKMCLKVDQFLVKIATFAFNSEELKISESCTIQKGELFLQTFKQPLFGMFTSRIRDTLELFVVQLNNTTDKNRLRILNIIAEINEYVYSHHNQDQTLLENNFEALAMSWSKIMLNVFKMDNKLNCVDLTIINLVTRAAMTCPFDLIVINQRFPNFKKWLLDLFRTKTNSLEIKSKGIFLLPCITNSDDKVNEELLKSLFEVHRMHLPLKSTEFPPDSLERSNLIQFTKSIFKALLTSKSPVIYRFLLCITVNEEKHILEEKLQTTLVKLMKSLKENEQETFFIQTFDIFMNESFDASIRLNIVKRYLLTILKNASVPVIMTFIKQKIQQIFALMDSKFDVDPENAFVNRSAGYMIIEAFAAGVPKEEIESATYSYGGNINNGLALIKELILKAKDVRRNLVFMVEDMELQETFRKFQCYCYRALASLVANTKDLPEVFNLCLFQENPQNGSYIWRKLINVRDDNIYSNWSQDFDEFPKVKQYIISIKDMDVNVQANDTHRKYIDSISIFDKSLSQTLTKTDLSYSVILSNREILEKSEKEHQKNMYINLESIPINENEIMGTLVGVVNFMYAKKLTVFSNFKDADEKKYEWVLSIANSLKYNDQHKNVKIFLAKLIENCRTIFAHYAEFLMGPLLNILTDGTFGNTLNFFITDLITMLLSWSHVYKPKEMSEINDAAQLLKFLMNNAYHDQNEIFRMNLELIKKLIETWKEIFVGKLPTLVLLGMLQSSSEADQNTRLICGIQINAVVLANNLSPWDNDEQCKLFVMAILSAFSNKSSKVYTSASQLMGLCLSVIQRNDENNIHLIGIVMHKLEKLKSQRDSSDLFMQLLYGIQKEYPSILDGFIGRIASAIPSAIRKTKCMYLEMFLARFEAFKETIFREVASINIKYLLKQNEYQLLALHIMNKAIEYLKPVEFMKFFDDLSYLLKSQNDEVKNLLYEIMIFSVQKYGNDPEFNRQKPMKIILKGFSDPNPEIQKRVVNFFNENSGLSKSFKDRFQELLTIYYDPQFERDFLNYATQLLMEIPIRHPRAARPLLDYDEGSNRDFIEYPINTMASSQKSLLPMFINSQQKQLFAGDGSQFNDLIRATQLGSSDHQIFAPTQDPIKMTQVSQTFNLKQTQNSLYASLKPQYLNIRSQMTQELIENEDLQSQIERNKRSGTDSLDYLRKRIVKKTSEQTSKHYAHRAVERRDFAEASRLSRIDKLKRGKEVVLYRRYRLGDFPDFFFNTLAILMPLQALVKKDDIIARYVFVSIFKSIVRTFDENHDEEAKNEFYSAVNKAIVFSLKNTVDQNPLCLGTFIELANISEKYLDIAPEIIDNSLSVTGILFLESQLLRLTEQKRSLEDDIRSVKRIKLDQEEIQIQHWMKLIDLYYKLNEFEIVNGIFTEKLRLDSMVKINLLKAIDYELNSEYKEAFEVYTSLIKMNAQRNQNEKDFYYNSYFNCLSHLSDWDQITQEVQGQLSGYDDIWDEKVPFHQNTLLPMLLKGELRKILNGDINEGFLVVLEDWLDDDKKNEHLHKKFPEEIGMLNILEKNYAACNVDMDKMLQIFSDSWSMLEMREDKLKLLSACRNIAEITNFVELMTLSEQSESLFGRIENLVNSWHTSVPHPTDSLILWNDLVSYRKRFLVDLTSKFAIDDETRVTSEAYIIDTERSILNVAFKQKNLDASNHLVTKLKQQLRDSAYENIFKYNLAVGKYAKMTAELKYANNNIQFMSKLGKAWYKLKAGIIEQEKIKDFPLLELEALETASEIAWKVFQLYQKVDEDMLTNDINQGFMTLMDINNRDANVMEHILMFAEKSLKAANKLAQKYLEDDYSPDKEIVVGDSYLMLGQFYRNVFVGKIDESDFLQLQMIKSMFRAISYESPDARIYIPYILQLPALKNNSITNEFNEQLNMVPLWMFLPYISQILSNFDFENDCFLDRLLLKLAETYPNALIFSYNLSRENFHYDGQAMEKALAKDISEKLSNRTMSTFIAALQNVVVPIKYLKYHFDLFQLEVSKIKTNEMFRAAVEKFYEVVFVTNMELKGVQFSALFVEYSMKVQRMKYLNWEKNRKETVEVINQLKMSLDEKSKIRPTSMELRKLCSWLAEYKWNGESDFIEIPGQYKGDQRPFVAGHVKVVRFEQQLKIFRSKQLPIELKMYGSDGKTYNFIIKYGEDLRQDQRIQQALKLMSDKLLLDKNCAQNRLKIDTYEVIPINSTCGILQIVNDAQTVHDFMQEISKNFMVKPFIDFIGEIRNQYRDYLIGERGIFEGWIATYENAVLKQDRTELIKNFVVCEQMIPDDILSRPLRNISVTVEAYYVLRKNFITSMAAMNIGHYLLGIGDRHLSNIMLDMKTGKLIGIDFGIAFGTAASLDIPELLPFRMSSHFIKVMEPMGINGLIKKNMMHTLSCLRQNKDAILTFLEVFVKEPTLDWLIRSKTKTGNRKNDDHWNPEKRIETVRRKIDGENPMKILIEELNSGSVSTNKDLHAAYVDMINGDSNTIRNKFKESPNSEILTVEDQVTCLIELATDKAILASTYIGWDPWF